MKLSSMAYIMIFQKMISENMFFAKIHFSKELTSEQHIFLE